MTIVSLKNISKVFGSGDTEFYALKNINLDIQQGCFSAINGPSGSGKSTLLNIIGLIDTPTMGEYYINGELVNHSDEHRMDDILSKQFGFVFQNYNLLPVLSAVENIVIAGYNSGISKSELYAQAESLLEQVGLGDQMHKKPSELSGGQQQRVSIARSLIGNPKLILADEPTASLDTKNTMSLIELMLELNEKTKTAFLFSTHDDRLLGNIKNIIKICDGELV
ncbi:MAG: ABC transporter ATP-binding protein [Alphaproteobacteria bacterium]